jgi:hypothetical protein
MTKGLVAAVALLVTVTASQVWAVEILKKEPPAGALTAGQAVYVDNGRCPKGQVDQVGAGTLSGGGRTKTTPRTHTCVPIPK